ncbi:hypothetical protein Y032_0298g1766 [Ancylostoma ceylanicum]|uniref:Uncharacterized protein n=1 Tax=Ancylostoma ceylanicum TaxID=53326 RepID=A0A016S5D3_9BILA|nr:hypothetical protein Y032_0298g1766 [Ancylostoma ceylanicum]
MFKHHRNTGNMCKKGISLGINVSIDYYQSIRHFICNKMTKSLSIRVRSFSSSFFLLITLIDILLLSQPVSVLRHCHFTKG